MQFYLHMSKKSSIFAVDLGIVPSSTFNYILVMKRECIWKCEISTTYFSVYCVPPHRGSNDVRFQVYMGRKWIGGDYERVEDAVRVAVYMSLSGNYDVTITSKEENL